MIKLIIILSTLIAFLYFTNKNIMSDTSSKIGGRKKRRRKPRLVNGAVATFDLYDFNMDDNSNGFYYSDGNEHIFIVVSIEEIEDGQIVTFSEEIIYTDILSLEFEIY